MRGPQAHVLLNLGLWGQLSDDVIIEKDATKDNVDDAPPDVEPEHTRPLGIVVIPTKSENIRISGETVPSFCILRKLAKSLTRAKINYNTLNSCILEKRFLRGLCPTKIPLKLPDTSTEIQLEWETAHIELNKKLTVILRKHWNNRVTTLQADYDSTIKRVRETSSPGVLNHILKLIKQYETEIVIQSDAKSKQKMDASKRVGKEKESTPVQNKPEELSGEPVQPAAEPSTSKSTK